MLIIIFQSSRWRGGRSFEQNRQPGQKNPTTGPRERNSAAQGAARSGQNSNQSNSWGGPREQGPAGPTQEQHVPVQGFNASEAKATLRRSMQYSNWTGT